MRGPGQPLDLSVDVFVDLRADLVFNFGAPYRRIVAGRRPQRIRVSSRRNGSFGVT